MKHLSNTKRTDTRRMGRKLFSTVMLITTGLDDADLPFDAFLTESEWGKEFGLEVDTPAMLDAAIDLARERSRVYKLPSTWNALRLDDSRISVRRF